MTQDFPLYVVAGTEDFYVRRNLQKALISANRSGRRIEYLSSGTELEIGIEDAISTAGLYEKPLLLVCPNPEKIPVEILKKHVLDGDSTVSILIVQNGAVDKDLRKLQEIVPSKKCFMETNMPEKSYDYAKTAQRFLIREMKSFDWNLSEGLADAMVTKTGTDLGTLWFELLKVRMYMAALGLKAPGDVLPEHVRPLVLSFREVTPVEITNALGDASVVKLVQAFDLVKSNSKEDPTMAACAWIGAQAMKWLHVAVLDAQKAPVSEGASRAGMAPYVYETFNLPIARRWTAPRLIHLLNRVATVQAAIRKGIINPWILLEGYMVSACQKVAVQPRLK